MNVVFHNKDRFASVRFDTQLRRCVDWDYILKLCDVYRPVGVPILGCDYFHDFEALDRISTNGPVWDCFRVSQRHRPKLERNGRRCKSVTIYPIVNDAFGACYAELRQSLLRVPFNCKIQVVLLRNLGRAETLAIRSLVVSAGHPEPVVTQMPLDANAMLDFGLARCELQPEFWNLVNPTHGIPLATILYAAESGTCQVHTPASALGVFDAMYFNHSTHRWEMIRSDDEQVSHDRIPLAANTVNLTTEEIGDLDLRFSSRLSIALMILRLVAKHNVKLYKFPSNLESAEAEHYAQAIELLNVRLPIDYTPEVDGGPTFVSGSFNTISDGVLRTIYTRSSKTQNTAMAVFTPAPGENPAGVTSTMRSLLHSH